MYESHPEKRLIGYARVSTYGQTLDSQLEQLRKAGCTAKIYREKVTGAHNDRRELLKMLKALAPGDVVTVTRIDRLARSTFDLFAIVKRIVRRQGAISITGRAVGGHCHQHRALDDCRSRRLGGRGARFNPHPHRRGPQPRSEARAAHGPETEIDRGTAGRGPEAARNRCPACRTRAQLRRGEKHDFEAQRMNALDNRLEPRKSQTTGIISPSGRDH